MKSRVAAKEERRHLKRFVPCFICLLPTRWGKRIKSEKPFRGKERKSQVMKDYRLSALAVIHSTFTSHLSYVCIFRWKWMYSAHCCELHYENKAHTFL